MTPAPTIETAAMRFAAVVMNALIGPAFQSPEEAGPGDPCGLIRLDGSICAGTLECYIDVLGPVPGCQCLRSPPCPACIEAPLVCGLCHGTVP